MNTPQEYGIFRCTLCGNPVFVPMGDADGPGSSIELTCSRGHTDSYDRSKLERPVPKPSLNLELKHLVASAG